MFRDIVKSILPSSQPDSKKCSKCKKTWPEHWFTQNNGQWTSPCKPCRNKNRARAIKRLTAQDQGKKYCAKCNKILSLDSFGEKNDASDGLNSRCKSCCLADSESKRRRDGRKVTHYHKAQSGHKVCCGCDNKLPVSWFRANKRSSDGFTPRCKACMSKEPEWMRNKLAAADKGLVWCNSCKTAKSPSEILTSTGIGGACRECSNKKSRAWRDENLDRARETSRSWRSDNPDKQRQATQRWAANNPDKMADFKRRLAEKQKTPEGKQARAALRSNRRVREAQNGGKATAQEVSKLYERQRGRCHFCRCNLGSNYHVDHLTPVSRGGSGKVSNLACTCKECNLQKNAKTPSEYIAWLREKGEFCTLNDRERAILAKWN